MKKLLTLLLFFSSLLIANAQNFSSSKFPKFGKKQVITCTTTEGSEIFKLSASYIKDKINKREVKFLHINGKKYEIELIENTKSVYDEKRQLIAEVIENGQIIYLLSDDTVYYKEKNKRNKMVFYNIFEEEVLVFTYKYKEKRSFVKVNHVNTPANQLLAAICFNEFVDKKVQAINNNLNKFTEIMLSY